MSCCRLAVRGLLWDRPLNFSEVIEALNQASGFDLYRLRAAINRTLADPKWIAAIRRALQIGQKVDYFDGQANRQCTGQILEFRKKEVLLLRLDTQQRWLVAYAAINLEGVDVLIRDNPNRGLGRHEVAIGDIVGFHDADQQPRSGKVIRLNDKTVTLVSRDQKWRVAYTLLHRVMEATQDNAISGQTIKP